MSEAADQFPIVQRLSTLSDVARLRTLRLLEREELSVGELAKALQLPQSTVSRHLKSLHDVGWVTRRNVGTASLYRVNQDALSSELRELWNVARRQIAPNPIIDQDDARLNEVLAERRMDSRAFFGQVGGEWDEIRRDLFGEAFTAEALLSLVQRDWIIADLGCGTGNAAEHLAPLSKRVIAIDREPAMLEAARKRLKNFANVEFRRGDLNALPLKDQEIDAALVFLVLHHLDSPQDALAEIARTLKTKGMLLIVDMLKHDRQAYRHTMGHKHLGFDEKQIKAWARAAGFDDVRFRRLRPNIHSDGPGLFVATMLREP